MTEFHEDGSGERVAFEVADVVLAGYTGRDQEDVRKHVEELAAHGVPGPERVPTFYRATPGLVVAADRIDVLGHETSGEVEFILLRAGGVLYVGLGSDHTDRGHERVSITHAKQLCAKVVATGLWRYDDVAPHWDRLVLRSFAGADRRPYQEGPVSELLDPGDILERVRERAGLDDLEGVLVFSGTFPLLGELTYADRFAAELSDEVTGARLSLDYAINVIDPLD
jgi:hypothetical protein